jgi:hypothetical protein
MQLCNSVHAWYIFFATKTDFRCSERLSLDYIEWQPREVKHPFLYAVAQN